MLNKLILYILECSAMNFPFYFWLIQLRLWTTWNLAKEKLWNPSSRSFMSPWNAWKISERSCGHVKNTPGNFRRTFWLIAKWWSVFFFGAGSWANLGFDFVRFSSYHGGDRKHGMPFCGAILGAKKGYDLQPSSSHWRGMERWEAERDQEVEWILVQTVAPGWGFWWSGREAFQKLDLPDGNCGFEKQDIEVEKFVWCSAIVIWPELHRFVLYVVMMAVDGPFVLESNRFVMQLKRCLWFYASCLQVKNFCIKP